jgi:Methylamine utilisation protein MauE
MRQGAIVFFAIVSQALLAAVFTSAALFKTLRVGDFARTLQRLGVSPQRSKPAAIGFIAIELITGLGLFVVPLHAWPRVLVTALAITFASAGFWALRAKRYISCNCFGTARRGRLGRRQIALLPGLLLLVAAAQWHPPDWNPHQGLLGLAALVTWLTCRQIPVGLWRELRGDRIALQESWNPASHEPVSSEQVVLR